MSRPSAAPYGSWASPISIEMSVAGSLSLREPRLDGDDVYWIEGRPHEAGRQVIVRWNELDEAADVTPAGFNARTMANEYGGGPHCVAGGQVFFSNLADGRIYRQLTPDSSPEAVTPAADRRYADILFDAARDRLVAVLEDHANPDQAEPVHSLVALELTAGADAQPLVLASGYDFYSTPRLNHAGDRLAWLCWNHPNMPWDGTELWLAELTTDGSLVSPRRLAGGPEESIVQPEWAPDGSLIYVSDGSGWWNLYRLAPDQLAGAARAQPLAPMEAEFAGPQWVFGMSWYGVAGDGSIVAIAHRRGRDELWLIPPAGSAGEPEKLAVPDTQISSLRLAPGRVVYLGASPSESVAVVLLDLASSERLVLRRSSDLELEPAYISHAEPISFPTGDGEFAHALFYPPTNPDFSGPAGEQPPLIVMSHGGPTGGASSALDLEKQVFTSRGFAVVDVDYRGSTGYGRAYMRALDGRWGIADVEDCINAARQLAAAGRVDESRMAIRGGSAGGFTTLCALAFHDVFKAGASYFGVGDLEALARDTHKFESRYLDRLVAPYPEGAEIYRQRSPIHSVDKLDCSLIVLQGRDDKIVPVDQAEQLVDALRRRGLPHAYICFDGEGHGFRQAQNITRALEAELSFYAQVFGFELADAIEPVAVS